MNTEVKQFRRLRQQTQELTHGKHEREPLPGETGDHWYGGMILFLTFGVTFIIELIKHWNDHQYFLDALIIAGTTGAQFGAVALACYLLLPLLGFIVYLVRYWRLPPRLTLKHFSWSQIAASIAALALLIVYTFNQQRILAWWAYWWSYRDYAHILIPLQAFKSHTFKTIGSEALVVFVLLLGTMPLILPRHARRRTLAGALIAKFSLSDTFSLWLGASTGELLKRKHRAAMGPKQHITLSLEDACKNILVLGGIGTGKTTCAIHPLLLQLLDQACGGLIFDIKGDFKKAVLALSKHAERDIITLGPEHTPVNLLLGGKVAYTFIKLRFFNLMQQRLTHDDWNQDRPVFFICDEFQEVVSCNKDGLSDLNFWDKARASKTIGIISAQSISSFYAAIGDRDMANALLQNFRQKLCFKTEDQSTLDYLNRLTGHVEVARRGYSSQSGHTSVPHKWSKSRHRSKNESLSFHDKPLIDAQLVRELGPNRVFALLSVFGYSMDDVIEVKSVYV